MTGLAGLGCLCGDPTVLVSSCTEVCAEDGRCGRRTWAAGDGFARCFPRDDADCEQSRACREEGRCDYRPERELEACVAAEEDSCLGSTGCVEEGRCRPDFTGRCRSSNAGCLATAGCAEHDRCEAHGDGCVVPRDDGPTCAQACRVEGACTEREGRCLATREEDCRASHLCRYAGACAVGPNATCVAGSDVDCRASTMCSLNGFCRAREGVCTEGLDVCQDACLELGWCGMDDAVCVPRTDADCESSLGCLVHGRCGRNALASRPICYPRSAADCAASLEGRVYGRTELRALGCAAPGAPPGSTSGVGCFRDPACATEGRCLTAPDQRCERPEDHGLPPIPPGRRPRVRKP